MYDETNYLKKIGKHQDYCPILLRPTFEFLIYFVILHFYYYKINLSMKVYLCTQIYSTHMRKVE